MANISKTYISGEIKVEALKKLNLKIEEGERIVVLGLSGSGKTTILNLLGEISSLDKIGDHLTIFGKNSQDYELKK